MFSHVKRNVFCFVSDLKVIIMGDFNVGKTSLICRYVEGKFKQQEPVRDLAHLLFVMTLDNNNNN